MLYVALSRVQSLDSLFLRDPIPFECFKSHWPSDLKSELKRLKNIERTTLTIAAQNFHDPNDMTLILENELELKELAFLQ